MSRKTTKQHLGTHFSLQDLWRTFRDRVLRRRFVQDVGVLTGAHFVGAALSFTQGILVARWLGPEAYGANVNARVYAELHGLAERVLSLGYVAIVDAVHDLPSGRRELGRIADKAGVPFAGYWLSAGAKTLARRIEARGPDASDATPAVMRRQLKRGRPPGNWRHLDSEARPEAILETVHAELSTAAPVVSDT